jgi:hypothetical protein
VRIVALGTIHLLLWNRVVLWQMKLGLDRTVTFETRGGIFSGVENVLAAAATTGDV